MIKTAKFGGSSVAGAEQFKKVKDIVLSDEARSVVVVSAAGKRYSGDHKLTDLLYLCHAHLTYGVSCQDIMDSIRERFVEIRDALSLSYQVEEDVDALCRRMNKDMSVDELVSRGEYFTARLMAEYLDYRFVDAADCIFFGYDGQLDREKTYAAIKKAHEEYGRILIPGFYGSLPNGKIKVMTRGGGDITGAIASAAVEADIYENWTDVSGILMADPKIVADPRPIEKLTFAELRELAFMGANVLHEDSILPVKEMGIPLNIRNTNRPQDAGTLIVDNAEADAEQERFLTGIAGRKNFTILTIRKHNMELSRTLIAAMEILDRFHCSVEHISLGLDTLGLVVSTAALGDSIYDIVGDLRRKSQADEVQIEDGIALVAAVGRKMSFRPGSSGKLFKALGEEGISIRTIAQGADELSIIIGVDNKNYDAAVRVLYHGFAG